VALAETGASGIVPMSSLGDDFWVHDETQQALIGRRTGRAWRLAQSVEVRLAEAAPLTGGLVFHIVGSPERGSASTKTGYRGRRH
jgi:ribonuclease R